MTTIYSPGALQALEKLWGTDPDTADRIESALDLLEADPSDPRCRAVSLRSGIGQQVWGLPIRTSTDDWIALWHYGDENTVRVLYIGINFTR
ncbi:type II toxin-antitoxin system RelE family toxin [Mycobacteroides abscessus]|uniref:type II toxin-antitoxin system RelE family toxin n=1 Tax=Mycobacteroides abscessus TaxID=36809 RepID=UPI0009A7B8CB|nr:hypothetical protein [Mycobacteroides abscessus]MBE5408271.1 hypothetical protein [Mycobacteroides abscessus]OTR18099.1 hypothetical protein B9M82_02760 [Mycobacteroides abscessus]SLC81431.1 Uncharacterised protein [Mycobacteroides abscessus subsp. massiliense]